MNRYRVWLETVDKVGTSRKASPTLSSEMEFAEFCHDLMRTGIFTDSDNTWIPPHCIRRVEKVEKV